MTFKPGDRVRPEGWPDHQDMAVKLVRDGYALCEFVAGLRDRRRRMAGGSS